MNEFVDIDEHVEDSMREFLGYCCVCGRPRVEDSVVFTSSQNSPYDTWNKWLINNHHSWYLPYCYLDDCSSSMFWFACDECIMIKGWGYRRRLIPAYGIKVVRGVDY